MHRLATVNMAQGLEAEAEMLGDVAAHPSRRFLWLWQSDHRCLVAPRKLASLSGFETVARALGADGWPVHLRGTGGDVTPQGPGIVNVSHIYASPPTKRFDLDGEYGRLCAPIEATLGSGASRGWQTGAFCDGAHNVQFEGRKFAGTAMRFRPCRWDKARYAVLAHALMLMAPPEPAAITALNRFLSALEQPRVIEADAHTGLPEGQDQSGFLARLSKAFAEMPDQPPLTPQPTHP